MKLPPRLVDTEGLSLHPGEGQCTASTQDEVVIFSDIPDQHPHKAAIEDRLHEAVTRHHGPWRVEVLRVGSGRWWLVCVERPRDGFRSTVLFPPWEQEPEHILKGVGDLLARA